MKNTINYYYQMNIDNFHLINGTYYFNYLNNNYKLELYKRDINNINELLELNYRLLKESNYFYEIILTKDKIPFLIIDNKYYVLLKISNVINDKMSFYDIFQEKIFIDNNINKLKRDNWNLLWSLKVDNLEEILNSNLDKYYNELPIFYYFIGLTENAISYYHNINLNNKFTNLDYYTVCHLRIDINENVCELYNPVNFIIDHRSRDISEYFKSLFIEGNYDYKEIEEYIMSLDFSEYGFSLLYSRLLYPTFFFDLCDELFLGTISKNELLKLGSRIEEYKEFLKEIFYIIRKKSNIEEVLWITKK